MKKYIITTLALQFGFTIIGRGFAKRHYCFTRSEALQWAACYDDGATIYVAGRAQAWKRVVKSPAANRV